jgi:hypothetical protein
MTPILGIMASQISGHLASPTSFDSIATVTVGSGGSSDITFSSIPSTYKHLQIRGIGRSTNTTSTTAYSAELLLQFNGDTTSTYNAHAIEANGSSVSAQYQTSLTLVDLGGPFTTQTANVFGTSIIDILDYSNTNKYKTVRALGGQDLNGYGTLLFGSGLWRNSASAISSIKMVSGGTGWAQYSSFALYGVKG